MAWPGVASAASNNYPLGIAYIALAATGVGNVAMKRLAGGVDPLMAMGIQLLLGAIPLALLSLSTESLSSVAWSTTFVLILARTSRQPRQALPRPQHRDTPNATDPTNLGNWVRYPG